MNRIKISEEAVQDLNNGYWFYEFQEKGLGDYFASSLRSEIDRLQFYAGIQSVVHEDFHHVVCKKFPFGIFYTFERPNKLVTVWAVLDLRRDPVWIKKRLL